MKDVSVTSVNILPPTPAVGIYRNTGGSAFALPAFNGRRTQSVPVNGYFAWDSRMFYPVIKRGDHFFPTEMERVIWKAVIRDDVFAPGSIASADFDMTIDLKAGTPEAQRLDVGAQYLLVFDYLETTDVAGAPNIGAAGEAVTIGEFRLSLSAASMTNRFGVRIARTTAEATSEAFGLNRTITGPTLPANFAMRCRLSCFDVDDTSADPSGTLTVTMPSTVMTIEKT
jgi:hypothetical protein